MPIVIVHAHIKSPRKVIFVCVTSQITYLVTDVIKIYIVLCLIAELYTTLTHF